MLSEKCARCTLYTMPLYSNLVYPHKNILGHQNKEACDSSNDVLNTQVVFKLVNNLVFNLFSIYFLFIFEWF